MKKSVRAWRPMLAAGMSLALFSACGTNSASPDASTAPPEQSAPAASASAAPAGPKKEISISVFDRGEVVAEEGTYENNRWSRWINENSPTKVNWVPIPRNQAQQKLNTLIASGGAPDLMWEFDRNYIAQLANQGAIQPIDAYIEKYSTTYKNYLQEHPELKSLLTFEGKMYAVSSARGLAGIANHGMWIRQDWLDKLGLKMPTTVEELMEVATKFRDSDPDGNGKADTVPIAFHGNSIPILRAFFMAYENQWYVEDGKLQFGRLLDRYTDSLVYQKKLFDEKLIDQEYITDTNFQRGKQQWVGGKAGIYLAAWNIEADYKDLKKNVPDAKPVPLEALSSKYGKSGLYQESPADIFTAFNADMKEDKIEAAFKFLDWMLEEGWSTIFKFGEENVHTKFVDGILHIIDADKFKKEVRYAREYAIVKGPIKPEWDGVPAPDELSQEYAKMRAASLEVTMKNKFRRDIAYSPTMPELTQLLAAFAPIAQQIEVKAIMGGKNQTAETAMQEIRKEWKRLGGDNVEKLVQEWYQANKKDL